MNIKFNFILTLNHRLFCILLLFLSTSKLQIVFGQDNLLDPKFGIKGKQLSTGGRGDNRVKFIHKLRDGKILFGAEVRYGKVYQLTLNRFEANGKADSSFGNYGILRLNNGGIELDSFENIYISGILQSNFRISKYHKDGNTDSTFANQGNLDISFSNTNAGANIKIRNNNIYIIGNLNSRNAYPYDLQKFDLNGIKDTTFGQNGTINFPTDIRIPSLELTADHKIIVTGGGDYNLIIRQYLQNGNLDSSFGINGEVYYNDTIKRVHAESIQFQNDQKILISGRANIPSGYKFLARFTSNGILDTGFADKGFLKVTSANAIPDNLEVFSNDQYITTIHIERITGYNSISIKRFQLNGSLDSTFANYGFLNLEYNQLSSHTGDRDAFMDTDGNFLLANSIHNLANNTYMQISSLNADGKINLSFGKEGVLDLYMGYNGVYCSSLLSIYDKSLIQGGTQYYSWGSNIQLNKFKVNGIPDLNWSNFGVYTPPGSRVFLYNNFGVLQPDGKILIGGTASIDTVTEYPTQMYVSRIFVDGTPDSSFGNKGISFINDKYIGYSGAYTLALENDGDILVGGYSNTYPSIVRLDQNGSVKLIFERMKYLSDRVSNKILIAKNDKIYNIGVGYYSKSQLYYSHVTRYLPDGKLDLEFGDSASTIISTATNDILLSGALDQHERILLAGYDTISGGAYEMFAWRVLPNGKIDSSFANNGIFRYKVNNQNSLIAEVLIDQQGRIYLGGTGYKTTKQDFILLCLDENGNLINSFGENGLVYVDFNDGDDYITSMIFDSDQNIILGGNSESTESYYMALAKVINNLNVGTIDETSNAEMQYIYPNPILDKATLKFSLNQAGPVSISISDVNGKLIDKLLSSQYYATGKHQLELQIPHELITGYYIITIHTTAQSRSVKFLKQ